MQEQVPTVSASPLVIDVRNAPETAMAAALRSSADMLARGELVVMPTETVYGICCMAGSAEGVERLRAARVALAGLASSKGNASDVPEAAATTVPAGAPAAWHAANRAEYSQKLGLDSPLARRLAEKLLPGPISVRVVLSPAEVESARQRIGALQGVMDDGESVLVRVADHPVASGLGVTLRRLGGTLVAERLPTATGGAAADAGAVLNAIRTAGVTVGCVLDAGPSRYGVGSTLVQLGPGERLKVVREGALDRAGVWSAIARRVLFVCTGNTCRSPMAAAIANELAVGRTGVPVHAESAGVSAGSGQPATREAVTALREMGVTLKGHSSRPLTRQMIDDAEAVYVMTRSHLLALTRLVPGLRGDEGGKVRLLDPEGRDVTDPIGGGQQLYHTTALRLRELITRRLKELDE